MKERSIKERSIAYHSAYPSGKIGIQVTKSMDKEGIILAYSPGAAFACREIQENPAASYDLTSRGHMIGVITNGTAVLGLGNIGSLAAKPVMEAKAALYKSFAGIDAIDLCVEERDPDKFIEIVSSVQGNYAAIHLEDIRSPDCFYILKQLQDKLDVPVFHDDQQGTAVVVAAAALNGLFLAGKKLENAKVVVLGAGASALASLDLLYFMGLKKENTVVFDSVGSLHSGRDLLPHKSAYLSDSRDITLEEASMGADCVVGLAAKDAFPIELVDNLAEKALLLALANPDPEVNPSDVRIRRPDISIATGRSDDPNQVNNALCFPYLMRGVLDVGLKRVDLGIQEACAIAISELGRKQVEFSAKRLLPSLFCSDLLIEIPNAIKNKVIAQDRVDKTTV